MAILIHFIDGKCHSYKVIKSRESRETCLTNHTRPISHHIMPLVNYALGDGHTDTDTCTDIHTHILMREPKQFQETRHVRPLATRAWFNMVGIKAI